MINLSSVEILTIKVNPKKQAHYIIGDADLEIKVAPNQWIEVGAGSMGVVSKISQITNFDQEGCICKIGRLVEVAEKALIQCGGNHSNNETINSVFSGFPLIQYNLKFVKKEFKTKSKNGKITTINSGSIIGESAVITSGVNIGKASVVGAGSIVVKDIEEYSIYAGNPAKLLKYRQIDSRFPYWDLNQYKLFQYLKGEIELNEIKEQDFRCDDIKVILSAEIKNDKWIKVSFEGIKKNGVSVKLNDNLKKYFSQINNPSENINISTNLNKFINKNL